MIINIIFFSVIISLQFVPPFNLLNYEYSALVSILVFIAAYIKGNKYYKDSLLTYTEHNIKALKDFSVIISSAFFLSAANTYLMQNCASSEPVLFIFMTVPSYMLGMSFGIVSGIFFERKFFKTLFFIIIFLLICFQSFYYFNYCAPFRLANLICGFLSGSSFYGFDSGKIQPPDYFFIQRVWVMVLALFIKYMCFNFYYSKYSELKSFISKIRCLTISMILFVFILFFLFQPDRLGFDGRKKIIDKVMRYKVESTNFIFHTDDVNLFNNRLEQTVEIFEFNLYMLIRHFKFIPSRKINVFIYSSEQLMAEITGEYSIMYVKPVLKEIHLPEFTIRYSEDLIRHELVHALSSDLADNIFKMPVNSGLVEGLAVGFEDDAAIEKRDKNMAAALKSGSLTKLDEVFSVIKFFMGNSPTRKKYEVAGAFIVYLRKIYGTGQILKWYKTNDFEKSFGKKISDAEKEWHEYLKCIEVSESRYERIKKQYDDASNPPLYKSKCMKLGGLKLNIEEEKQPILSTDFIEESLKKYDLIFSEKNDTEQLYKKAVFLKEISRFEESRKIYESLLEKNISIDLRERSLREYIDLMFFLKQWKKIPELIEKMKVFFDNDKDSVLEEYRMVLSDKKFREEFSYIFLMPNRFDFDLTFKFEKFRDNPVFIYFYTRNCFWRLSYSIQGSRKNLKSWEYEYPLNKIHKLKQYPVLLSDIIRNVSREMYYNDEIKTAEYLINLWEPEETGDKIRKQEWKLRFEKRNILKKCKIF
ncbi:hypothetical protein KA977_03415 [Candidatus Dependentiae bacterium]|nr:hypothetical protein [Candidatus Dependentiae bacterium]